MQTVAVTGVTGKSGQFFLQRLILEADNIGDYKFIFLCRKISSSSNTDGHKLAEKIQKTGKLNIEFIEVNLESKQEIETFFSTVQINVLLHIAGVSFSEIIVPVALANGVDNHILVHTTGIYSKYKAAGEEYRRIESNINSFIEKYKAKGRNISVTILRPTMIYGDLNDKNISIFIKMVDKLRIFPIINGAKYDLQPVYCKDLGNAYFDVLMNWETTKNKEYILSGGKPIQLIALLKEIEKQLGVKNTYVSCPFIVAYAGAWILFVLSIGKVDMREKVQRLVEPRAYSHNKASFDFGYNPTDFETGVRQEIKMYMDNKKV